MKPRILVVGEDGFNGEVAHFVINRDYGDALSAAAFGILYRTGFVDGH